MADQLQPHLSLPLTGLGQQADIGAGPTRPNQGGAA